MKSANTITQLLFPLFIGFIIGGAASKNTPFLVWGIILLVLDIIIGISLQSAIDRKEYQKTRQRTEENFSDDELDKLFTQILLEKAKEDSWESYNSATTSENEVRKVRELPDIFDEIYEHIEAEGGKKNVRGFFTEEACFLLLDVCNELSHSPRIHTINTVYSVATTKLGDGTPAIIYYLPHSRSAIGHNAFIYLTRTGDNRLRLFTVETNPPSFFLCEYSGNRHVNYGRTEAENAPAKIEEILSH